MVTSSRHATQEREQESEIGVKLVEESFSLGRLPPSCSPEALSFHYQA
jgi:hypothetical protein